MDYTHIIAGLLTLAGTALAHYIATGGHILIDPGNTRPTLDAVRDAVRKMLVDRFGHGTAAAVAEDVIAHLTETPSNNTPGPDDVLPYKPA